jgi:hypothetical protein
VRTHLLRSLWGARRHHNFPPDFPAPDIPIAVLSTMFSHPSFFCVVAEQGGKVIGSNCLDEKTLFGIWNTRNIDEHPG